MTSQQPYQELQAVIRAKEAVEAENAEIKSRLASIMSLIQPILNNPPGEFEFIGWVGKHLYLEILLETCLSAIRAIVKDSES